MRDSSANFGGSRHAHKSQIGEPHFMKSIIELRARKLELTQDCDSILTAYETNKRPMAHGDQTRLNAAQREMEQIESQLKSSEKNNSLLRTFSPATLMSAGQSGPSRNFRRETKVLTEEYAHDFFAYVASGGKLLGSSMTEHLDTAGGGFAMPGFAKPSAALYEGSNAAGGYAVPLVVDDQIVPLAPQEMAVRQLAQVIPTSMDIKIPQKSAFGTDAIKAETASFAESDTALTQITLSAFMAGIQETCSWELAQDVPAFQSFIVDDMLLAQQMFEENLYVNGTGSGQAQGLIGNVGTGYGPQEPDGNGNLVSITGILNQIGTLNSIYHPGASFLMQRATSIVIRKAQMESNLFYPAFTRDPDGTDRLFNYPVKYSAYMPSASRGNTPLLFGDFKRGYVIGDRGGSGINVKVLDQVAAQQGEIVLLAYRRTDGRVRRSEAIQSYQVSAS